jgi:hypothetical protein
MSIPGFERNHKKKSLSRERPCFKGTKTGRWGMLDHFAHSKWLRERGAEFRRVANTAKEQHTKESFLKLARSFEALAEAEEGVGTKGVPERGPTDA